MSCVLCMMAVSVEAGLSMVGRNDAWKCRKSSQTEAPRAPLHRHTQHHTPITLVCVGLFSCTIKSVPPKGSLKKELSSKQSSINVCAVPSKFEGEKRDCSARPANGDTCRSLSLAECMFAFPLIRLMLQLGGFQTVRTCCEKSIRPGPLRECF